MKQNQPLRILVVDDLPIVLQLLQVQLHGLGHRVFCASDAEVALQCWQSQGIDVVLTDCQLPGMSGPQWVSVLRAQERETGGPATVVVGCTVACSDVDRHAALAAGMDTLLPKPLSCGQLLTLLAPVQPCLHFAPHNLTSLAHGNSELSLRLLATLSEDLAREALVLAADDPASLKPSLHRLKGLAVLIDALPLARSLAALAACAGPEQVASVQRSVARLGQDIAWVRAWPDLRDL